jgi:hypothetical protein
MRAGLGGLEIAADAALGTGAQQVRVHVVRAGHRASVAQGLRNGVDGGEHDALTLASRSGGQLVDVCAQVAERRRRAPPGPEVLGGDVRLGELGEQRVHLRGVHPRSVHREQPRAAPGVQLAYHPGHGPITDHEGGLLAGLHGEVELGGGAAGDPEMSTIRTRVAVTWARSRVRRRSGHRRSTAGLTSSPLRPGGPLAGVDITLGGVLSGR